MPSAGPNLAGSGTVLAGAGITWSNPGNITLDDGSYAYSSLSASDVSKYLFASNFGFALTASDTIDGITVVIEEQQDSTAAGNARDVNVFLYNAVGSQIGNNKATLTSFQLSPTWATITYGGAADTWGASLSASLINSSAFGVGFSCEESTGAGPAEPRIDYVKMTVNYTSSSGTRLSETRMATLFRCLESETNDDLFD